MGKSIYAVGVNVGAAHVAGVRIGKAHITVLPSYVEKLGKKTMLIIDPNGVEIEITQAGQGTR